MDVAVLGASGDCGREIAAQIVATRLLDTDERLQLVGRADGPSARVLHGLVSDLTDAHAEHVPDLDVALSPEEIAADVWVVAAGRTLPTQGVTGDRQGLAESNGPLFAAYAEALARRGQGTELVVVVSNPVELGVALFSRAIGRDRVIGIGGYQDTNRFRRELAAELGVRRQRVGAFMLGEHGAAQVPIWSSVRVHGLSAEDAAHAVAGLRRGIGDVPFAERCRAGRAELDALMDQDRIADAFARVEEMPADVRVVLRPFVTHRSGAKTVRATAGVTVDLLRTLLDGREALIAGQAMVQPGEFYDMTGPLGVPVIAGPDGIRRVVEIPLADDERTALGAIAQNLSARTAEWMEAL